MATDLAITWGTNTADTGQGTQSAIDRKQTYERWRSQYDQERASFVSHWRELNDYILPRRGRFTLADRTSRGNRRNTNIIDSTATQAVKTLASGIMSGASSPARPWLRLTVPDPELAELAHIKDWLHTVTRRMLDVFARSNLYDKLPVIYKDLGVFGTAALLVVEDDRDVIRCIEQPIGSFYLANDAQDRVRVFMREFSMTVRQLVQMFGGGDPKKPDWKNFSQAVKAQWDRKQYEQWIEVVHVISPNEEYYPNRLASKYKPFVECYYEKGTSDGKFLRESGYDEWPLFAPRWETSGEDVYGTDCPGMTALGDIKALQLYEKRKAQAIDKQVNPPLVGPAALRGTTVSQLPGGITYTDSREGVGGLRPLYEMKINLMDLTNTQNEHRYRINAAFHADLFLMITNLDRREITATEIQERREEKLLVLGPLMGRLDHDLFSGLIDRTFGIMARRGMIPPAPEELEGVELKVEYMSIMAQAQKAIGLGGLRDFATMALTLAKETQDTSMLDKVDFDQFLDEYSEMSGTPPRIIVPDEDVVAIRQQRAQAQQAQQQAELAEKAAGAAKALSETDTERPSALRQLMAGSAEGDQL